MQQGVSSTLGSVTALDRIYHDTKESDKHDRAGETAAGKKCRKSYCRNTENSALTEYGEIDSLQFLNILRMSGEGKEGLCPIEGKQPQTNSSRQGKVDPLPENLTNSKVIASASVLGNKHSRVTADTSKKCYKKIRSDAGGEGCRDRI